MAERLEKKDAPRFLYKSTTQNKPFFNKDQIFVIKKVPFNNSYYWISKKGEENINNKRYIRQPFVLNNQFAQKWKLYLFILIN